jgi:hypothetical protein
VHHLVVLTPSVAAPCAREGEGKLEEVDEEHIEQVVHQNKVVVKNVASGGPPPRNRGGRRGARRTSQT